MIILLWNSCLALLKELQSIQAVLDREVAAEYFDRYFPWYNTEHYHSGIDYVTPEQCHRGLREEIVFQRKTKLQKQRQLRKEVNRSRSNAFTEKKLGAIISPGQMRICSVMNS